MLQTCPNCNSENREEARYCDQCGIALSDSVVQTAAPSAPAAAATPAAASSTSGGSVNWGAIFFIVIGIAGLIWMIKAQGPKDQVGLGMPGGGGSGNPTDTMKAIQGQLKDLKKKLDANPTDVATLKELYTMYGQVGKTEEVRPYLQKALTALEGKPGDDAARQQIADLAEAAMGAEDNEGLILCLTTFNKVFPEEVGALAYLGDVTFRLGQLDASVDWYTKYLAAATPEGQGPEYWEVTVSRGATYLEQYKKDKNEEALTKCMADLQSATTQVPTSWNAFYNLGNAYLATGEKDKARAAWTTAVTNATDAFQKWEAQAEIDKLDGKEPAPMPNPHGEGFGTTPGAEGMANPHASPNPHGEASANPHGEAPANPHGEMPSPHGEQSSGS